MRSIIVFVAALLLFAGACLAQPTIEWQKCLGGSAWDWTVSIQQTRDGGYIVAGYSYSNDGDISGNHGNYDYWVVKLNSAGAVIWQKSLGGSSWDRGYSIQQTSDGGFIIAGESWSNDGDVSGNHGWCDYWVVKLNSAGDIVWQRSLGGSDWDEAYSIQQTTDGGFIVAGDSWSNDGDVSGHHGTPSGSSDYWVVKLNSAGAVIWQKSLGGSDGDEARSIQQTSDGGFIVAGWSDSNDGDVSGNHGGHDYWVVKLSPEDAISESNKGLQPLAYTISAHPNPFNSSCAITAPAGADVEIYDLRGNVVYKTPSISRSLSPQGERDDLAAEDGSENPSPSGEGGSTKSRQMRGFIWTPDKSTPSGIYLIRATIGDRTITKQAILMK